MSTKLKSKIDNPTVLARVYGLKDSILVKVPISMTTIPEVPEVILQDNWVAVLQATSPLEYRMTTYGKAKSI